MSSSHRGAASRLKKRAIYFLGSHRLARNEVAGFVTQACERGQPFIVGGMLRDLILGGNRDFVSDVDFVIDQCSADDFDSWMTSLGAQRNRFGGFGITLGRWKVDIWLLERSWAAVSGHCNIKEPSDFLKATFFDWDSIIYGVHNRQLLCDEGYFDRIERRLLDVKLLPNPNPLGNAVRAIRYAYRWDASFGPCLANHVLQQIMDNGWERLVDAERMSFHRCYLRWLNPDKAISRLQEFERKGADQFVRLIDKPIQQGLHFSSAP